MDASLPGAVPRRSTYETYFRPSAWPFWAFHVICVVGLFQLGFSWAGLGLAVAFYYLRMFFVCGAYHRYFSHRTYKTSRWFQFVLALCAQTTAQKGVLWWASHHRHHHKYSDFENDVHSAKLRGFWYSHCGWILGPDWNDTDYKRVGDIAKFPELRVLNHPAIRLLPAAALAVAMYLVGGWFALFWGFFVSTTILWHGTFTINSLSHMFGNRRYQTTDDSRNNWLLALVTLGEGWHNNHHHYQSSANQGFRWYEIDPTYYVLKLWEAVGLIWDVRKAPDDIVYGTEKAAKGTSTGEAPVVVPVPPAAAAS